MAGNRILATCALLLYSFASACPETLPPLSACGQFGKSPDDEVTRKATTAFLEHTHSRIHDYKISRQDCGDTLILFFEGVGKDANVGYHWIIVYCKATGKIRIIDGM
jgi:hypothetical protein